MSKNFPKCFQTEVDNLMNQLSRLADALRKVDESYRVLQNSYMQTALQFSQLKALADYIAADAGKETE